MKHAWATSLVVGLALVLITTACTAEQRAALQSAAQVGAPAGAAAAAVPSATPYFAALNTPVPPPPAVAIGPLATLTALAPVMAQPTLDPRPIVIVNRGKPHFLDFNAWWCSPCNAMRPTVRYLEEQYGDRIDFHDLNVDQPGTRNLAMQYRVTGIPMIVLLNAQGKTVQTLLGYQTEEQLSAALDNLLAGTF